MTSALFRKPLRDACVVESSFGGGWIFPTSPAGSDFLLEFFDEEPGALAPLGGTLGYVVEPQQADELAEFMRSAGITWEVRS